LNQFINTGNSRLLIVLIQKISSFSKTAGPGILFASTAIGVSHLVQSTRAGADYGLLLMGFVVLVMVMKYPFFEYGSRYANVTQTSIIDGYKKLGKPALWTYFLLTISSMFFVTGAVGFVTAGFFENLFGISFLGEWTIIILFAICVSILTIGKYNALDSLMKIVAIVLLMSTVSAFLLTLWNGPVEPTSDFIPPDLWTTSGIFFLLALMGWMPTAVDLSSWNSLWTLERMKQTNYRPKLKETLFEFRLAYVVTGVLAVMFVTLGAFIFYGSGEVLPNNNAHFAQKIVTMYTQTIGDWSYVIITASAFTVMFGTILAIFDGYSRSLHRTMELLFSKQEQAIQTKYRSIYIVILLFLATGSLVIVLQFGDDLRSLVDFATVLSFVIAPIIAIFNFKLVGGKYLEKQWHPSTFLKGLSVAGIVFLIGFAIVFLITRF